MCNPAFFAPLLAAAPAAAATTTSLSLAGGLAAIGGAVSVAGALKKPKLPGAPLRIPEPEAKGQQATRAEESARGRLLSEQEAGKTRRRKLRLRGADQSLPETGLKIPIL